MYSGSARTAESMYFEKVVGYHLADSSAILETTFGRRPLECVSKCIIHQDCVMVDVQKTATSNYQCDLLSPVSAYSLILGSRVDHYRPKVG